jgi:hypothetical protein
VLNGLVNYFSLLSCSGFTGKLGSVSLPPLNRVTSFITKEKNLCIFTEEKKEEVVREISPSYPQ